MGVARTGQGGEKPWDGHREQPKENPGAVVARRAGKMPMAVQHGGELGGDAGEAPQPPRNTALVQGLRDQLLESSNSLLSPGDFCTVFSELLFQAGQEVGCFRETPWLHQAGMCGDGAIRQLGEPAAGRGHSHGTGKGLHSFSIK